MENYKIKLEMGWEFTVRSQDQKEALVKIVRLLEKLLIQDGSTSWALKAIKNIEDNEYDIKEYIGYVVK